LNHSLKKILQSDFYNAGLYLGKVKNGVFFPSFNLLNLIAKLSRNKVIVDQKAAWLFICSRDVFQTGILKAIGSKCKGDFTLVMNEFGECLGYGKLTGDFEKREGKFTVENLLDIGDFLRRETKSKS
jgi:ribosome biogenesis protein Nip4